MERKLEIKDIENEIWKDVYGYEGLYQISNLGKIKSIDRIEETKGNWKRKRIGKILKTSIGSAGYRTISLWKNGKAYPKTIHRLVAYAFIPNYENKPNIDHINTDKLDNRSVNLKWCTQSENARNEITKTRYPKPSLGKTLGKSHLAKKVNQYDLNMNFMKTWDSAKEIALFYGFSKSNITDCLKGKITKTHGYKFKYYE